MLSNHTLYFIWLDDLLNLGQHALN